jgi:urate oxidase
MLSENRYGKSGIRLVKLIRRRERHEIRDWTVAVTLEGDFAAAHEQGDNARVLPTDTMKNTVYALAAEDPLDSMESFGLALSRHFLEGPAAPTRVTVSLEQHPWERITPAGGPHPNAFLRPGGERRLATVTRTRGEACVEAGIEGLTILKSAGSAFAGFLRDRFTTLRDATDRIFATSVSARWLYSGGTDLAWELLARAIRGTLLDTFADHKSASVQHTLHAMGEAVLERHPEVDEIRLTLPNKHHIPVDLSPFGLENHNEVFVATEEPYGKIEATLRRG